MPKKAQNKDSAEQRDFGAENGKETTEKEQEQQPAQEENSADAAAQSDLQQELCDTQDMLLRLKAEYANFRKRSEKEKQDSFSFATAAAVKALLPVADNLERALQNESEDLAALRKGVEMTYQALLAGFTSLNIELFAEQGDIFNPQLHNAVGHMESGDYKDGEIVEVYQKGCKLGDKVIRPAMVKTAN